MEGRLGHNNYANITWNIHVCLCVRMCVYVCEQDMMSTLASSRAVLHPYTPQRVHLIYCLFLESTFTYPPTAPSSTGSPTTS